MSRTVFCSLPQQHAIVFTGEESRTFLNNLLTCDVSALTPDRSTYGGFCTPKGRLLATFLLRCTDQGFVMHLPAQLHEAVLKRLSMYVLRSKVRVSDASNTLSHFGVAGDEPGSLLQRLFGAAPSVAHAVAHLPEATLIRLPTERYEVVVPSATATTCLAALRAAATEAEPSHWNWLDIHAGIPVILPATQEEFVPQMVNLDCIGGVSFTKGCYPGQEIVARMHYLGRLKQRMYRAHIASDAAPRAGDRLYSTEFGAQSTGMIVSAAAAPAGGYDVLAVVNISSTAAGKVHWNGFDRPELAFLPLPYNL